MTQTQMQALAITQLGGPARLMKWPRPQVNDESVLIRVHFSGISIGTEMWLAAGKRKDYGEPPFINGYQVTGQIVELGAKVTSLAVGDLVAAFCAGAHCQYVMTNASLVQKLPNVSIAKAAALFVQPSVAANALNRAGVNSGDSVLVIGQGLIGQCTAMLARLRGAFVIASDISPGRLALAARHCADWVLDARSVKVSEQVKQRFPRGVDVVIESTGFQGVLDDALECCADGGRFVFEGWYPDQVSYTFQIPHGKQLRAFYPCWIGPAEVRESVLRLMSLELLNLHPLISHTPNWKQCADLYNQLFTPQRNEFNGIVIDWRS